MSPKTVLFLVMLAAGGLCFLGWLHATRGNPRQRALLSKSLLFFALPILFIPWSLLAAPWIIFVPAVWEEVLKFAAIRDEKKAADRFWLVILYGLWELVLSKSFYALNGAQLDEGLNASQGALILFVSLVPLLLHAVTAAVYAYTFAGRLWAAFVASCVLHVTYNTIVEYQFETWTSDKLALLAALVVFLAGALLFIVARRPTAITNQH